MVNKSTHLPRHRVGIAGAVAALAAGSWGFVVSIASGLPCLGDDGGLPDPTGFTSWLCSSGTAGWLYLAPMVLVPMALMVWSAVTRTAGWQLLTHLACMALVTVFVPSILERLW